MGFDAERVTGSGADDRALRIRAANRLDHFRQFTRSQFDRMLRHMSESAIQMRKFRNERQAKINLKSSGRRLSEDDLKFIRQALT